MTHPVPILTLEEQLNQQIDREREAGGEWFEIARSLTSFLRKGVRFIKCGRQFGLLATLSSSTVEGSPSPKALIDELNEVLVV